MLWQKQRQFNISFKVADVTALPYDNASMRGYVLLGVVEYFMEGPQKALREAYRLLEPGGIAIITTPSISWNIIRQRVINSSKNIIKRIIKYPISKRTFVQHEYTPFQLKKIVDYSGLMVTEFSGVDLLYPFTEFGNYCGDNLHPGSIAY